MWCDVCFFSIYVAHRFLRCFTEPLSGQQFNHEIGVQALVDILECMQYLSAHGVFLSFIDHHLTHNSDRCDWPRENFMNESACVNIIDTKDRLVFCNNFKAEHIVVGEGRHIWHRQLQSTCKGSCGKVQVNISCCCLR